MSGKTQPSGITCTASPSDAATNCRKRAIWLPSILHPCVCSGCHLLCSEVKASKIEPVFARFTVFSSAVCCGLKYSGH